MKTLLLTLLIPALAFSQEKVPFPGANTITVKNVSFNDAVSHLLDIGITVDKIDKEFKILTTMPIKMVGDSRESIVIQLHGNGSNAIVLSANFFFNGKLGEKVYSLDLKNLPEINQFTNELFDTIDKIANSFTGGEITYTKL